MAIPAVSRRASGRLPCCPRSCKPPYDPGQRDFPGPVLTLAVLHRPSHDRGEAQALTCIHPAHAGLPENSSPLRRQRCPGSVSGRHHGTAKRPEPLRLGSVLPPRGRHLPPSRRALPLRLRSYRLMRQTCCPPAGFGIASRGRSLQLAVSHCWAQALPDVISANPSPRVWTPTPAAPMGARARCFPTGIGLPRVRTGSAHRFSPTATSVGTHFRSCSHSLIFRPTGLLATQVAPTSGFRPRQQWLLRPRLSRFVTSPCSGYAIRPNPGN